MNLFKNTKSNANFIEAPCKIGEEFYFVTEQYGVHNSFNFSKMVVKTITYDEEGVRVWANYKGNNHNGQYIHIGTDAFRTKSELLNAYIKE